MPSQSIRKHHAHLLETHTAEIRAEWDHIEQQYRTRIQQRQYRETHEFKGLARTKAWRMVRLHIGGDSVNGDSMNGESVNGESKS